MDEKQDDDARMPEWFVRSAYFWRGGCLGVILGYLLAKVFPDEWTTESVIVILVASLLLVLPSIPKAWIEQRNRLRDPRRSP